MVRNFFFIIRSLYQKTGSILHWELAGNDFGSDGLITVCDALSRYSPIRRLEISNNFVPRGLLTKSAASNQQTIGDALADLANSTIARLKCQITPLAFFYILSLLVFARLFAFPVSLTDPFRRGFFFFVVGRIEVLEIRGPSTKKRALPLSDLARFLTLLHENTTLKFLSLEGGGLAQLKNLQF
jgi:hypothetical protein